MSRASKLAPDVCVCVWVAFIGIDRTNRLADKNTSVVAGKQRVRVWVCVGENVFLFGINRANRLTKEKRSVVAGQNKTQHAF